VAKGVVVPVKKLKETPALFPKYKKELEAFLKNEDKALPLDERMNNFVVYLEKLIKS
jgi:hypothetical protein